MAAGRATAAASIAAVEVGMSWALPAIVYLAAVGGLLAVLEVRARRLPNALVVGSYPIEVLLLAVASTADGTWTMLGRAALGAIGLFAFFVALALVAPGQLGFGNVKLSVLYALGRTWWGWPTLLIDVLAVWALAALYVSILVWVGRRRGALPLAPVLVAGPLVAWGMAR